MFNYCGVRLYAGLVTAAVISIATVATAAGPTESLLLDAVRAGDHAAAVALIRRGADVNARQPDGTTALHWAAYTDNLPLVERLIAAGANVNAKNRYGVAPLSLASVNGNAAVVKCLLEAGADANAPMPGGETPVMSAARAGNADVLRLLAAHGADVNATFGDVGQTALMWAAAANRAGAIKVLLELGADRDARSLNPDPDNGGARTRAITRRSRPSSSRTSRLESARRKTSPALPTPALDLPFGPRKFTAFHFATRAGNIEAMKALLDAGVDVNEPLADGTSPLVLAVISNKLDAAAFLLDHGADPSAAGQGWTALHQLVWTRRPNVGLNQLGPVSRDRIDGIALAKKLLERGADVNARMTKPASALYTGRNGLHYIGGTPFFLAAHRADLEYMKFLLENGADSLLPNENNSTPLIVAAGAGLHSPGENPGTEEERDAAVRLILAHGADPNTVDAFGMTALHGAAYSGANGAVEALVAAGAKLDVKNMITKMSRTSGYLVPGWTPAMIAEGILSAEATRKSARPPRCFAGSWRSGVSRLTTTSLADALSTRSRIPETRLRRSKNGARRFLL